MKTSKKETLKGLLENLKQQKNYFSYEDIKSLLKKEKIEINSASLKVYIHELAQNKIIFDAGKGWYSSIEKIFELNIKPIRIISNKLKKQFPLLKLSCWSTEQLNSFTHHLMAKFVTFVYIDSDYIGNIANFLEESGYRVYLNPGKQEIKKLFKIDKKTVVILPSISKQPESINGYAPIEKILIDFLMENRNFKIMEKVEAENVAINAICSGRINISTMNSYAKRRKFNESAKLTKANNTK